MTALRVLIDVSAGTAVADWFRQNGHDTQSVRDRDPKMEDTDILAWAVGEQWLVVTMDKDFGELVYRSGQAHAEVLLLRLESASTSEKIRAGNFAVYRNGRLRIRP